MSVVFRHHRLIQEFKERLKKFRSQWLDPSSLGTQLSLSMMAIVVIVLVKMGDANSAIPRVILL